MIESLQKRSLKNVNKNNIKQYVISGVAGMESYLLRCHILQQNFEDYSHRPSVKWTRHGIGLTILVFELICNLRWLTLSFVDDRQIRGILGQTILL